MMKLSVIIPCLNGADTIATQLEALVKQEWSEPWEVIVSDNGSTDESLTIVERYKGKLLNLSIVDSSDLMDRAHACNVGVRTSTGDAVAFCDVDDEVAPGWVAAMGKGLSQYDFVVCQHDLEKLNAPWVREAWNPGQDGPSVHHGFLPAVAGCRIGVKRSLYEALGGFAEPGLRIEDKDFCWRAQLAGVNLHFVPGAVVRYRFRSTFAGTYDQARLDGISQVFLYKKYASLGMPWRSWKVGARAWATAFQRLLQVRRKGTLLRWVAQMGFLTGRLQGSIKFRVLAL